jgi:hypothetical protein
MADEQMSSKFDFGSSAPNPSYCEQFGCPGCSTVREAMQKHWKNSDAWKRRMDEDWDKVFGNADSH